MLNFLSTMFFAVVWLRATSTGISVEDGGAMRVRVSVEENGTAWFLDLNNDYRISFVLESKLRTEGGNWLELNANYPWRGSLRLAVDDTGTIHGGNGHLVMDRPMIVTFDSSEGAFMVREALQLGSRRRLAYKKYRCHKGNKVTFLIGVVVDPTARDNLCDAQSECKNRVNQLVAEASVPFEHNFGIVIRAKEIIFPSSVPWPEQCPDLGRVYKDSQSYLVDHQLADKYATWVLLTGCLGAIVGEASGHSICTKSYKSQNSYYDDDIASVAVLAVTGRDSVSWIAQVELLAHELGHNFGAGHTFSKEMWGQRKPITYRKFSNKGLMDYFRGGKRIWDGEGDGEVQFHSMHERYMCAVIDYAIGGELNPLIRDKMSKVTRLSSNACFEAADTIHGEGTKMNYWIYIAIAGGIVICILSYIVVAWIWPKMLRPTSRPPTQDVKKKAIPSGEKKQNTPKKARHKNLQKKS